MVASPDSLDLAVGEEGGFSLEIMATSSGGSLKGTEQVIEFTSEDPSIVTVDNFVGTKGLDDVVPTFEMDGYITTLAHVESGFYQGYASVTCHAAGGPIVITATGRLTIDQFSDTTSDTMTVTCTGAPAAFQVTPGMVEVTHIFGTSPCPQDIATVVVRNNGDAAIDWSFNSNVMAVIADPNSGNLAAGAEVMVQLQFDCDPRGIDGPVTFTAGTDSVNVAVKVIVEGGP